MYIFTYSKVAGTSIERFLREIDLEIPQKVLRKRGFSRFLNDYPDYFVFSFVRNPYDRFVSAWKWGELKIFQRRRTTLTKKKKICILRGIRFINYRS